ncbi:EamA family transporter RarD [candidate division KSB1 bacterium]|nr:EamA family transporter RarD [candidate division KSB1 bacterium]
MRKGFIYAVTAYLLWGLLPVYWKAIKIIPPYEILFHRMCWTFMCCAILLVYKRHWSWVVKLKKPLTLITFIGTAVIIGSNWFTYIWAVNSGYIVESSLGYFINPLVNVLFGMVFLKEKLRLGQVAAIIVAAIGVLYLTFNYGSFPWIALILATTFGFYGLLRKTAALNSLEGLASETGVLFIPAVIYLVFLQANGTGSVGHITLLTTFLLIGTGVITAFPLLLFTAGARRITLTTLGILQYIAPTFQFLIGVFVYNENFPKSRLIGFMIIWVALIIYTAEGIYTGSKNYRSVKSLI